MNAHAAPDPDFETALEDFDAALARLEGAQDSTEARRALNECLGGLYALQERAAAGDLRGYWACVDRSSEGRTAGGLNFIRGRAVHHLTQSHEGVVVIEMDDPSPMPLLFPGANWWWLDWDELERRLPRSNRKYEDDGLRWVRERVAGRVCAETLEIARRFLIAVQYGLPLR